MKKIYRPLSCAAGADVALVDNLKAMLIGNLTPVGSKTGCVSNGTSTIVLPSELSGITVQQLLQITSATTGADKGFYIITGTAGLPPLNITLDRPLSGSDSDVAITVYRDVIAILGVDGASGIRVLHANDADEPLQLGGHSASTWTWADLAAGDVLVPGSLETSGRLVAAGGLDVVSSLAVYAGSVTVQTTTVDAASYDTLPTDFCIMVDYTDTGPCAIELQTADVVDGRTIIIKDRAGGALSNTITVSTEGSETIDGAATKDISVQYGCLRLISDGANWFTI